MGTIGEEGSGALDAVSDLVDLLRLAHEAAHRLNERVHSELFEHSDAIVRDIHDLRQRTESLKQEVDQYVKKIESA